MSFQSLADVFAYVQDAPLTSSEVLVLLTVAHYANRAGANAYPSLATLGTMTKLCRRKLQYTLRALEQKQLVQTTLQRGRTGKQTYALLVPQVDLTSGAPHAPLATVKGAYSAHKGAQRAAKGAPHAPDPIQDPERKRNVADVRCARGTAATTAEAPMSPDSSPQALQTLPDTETVLHDLAPARWEELRTHAHASLIAEGVPRWALITPVIEARMIELWHAEQQQREGPPDDQGTLKGEAEHPRRTPVAA